MIIIITVAVVIFLTLGSRGKKKEGSCAVARKLCEAAAGYVFVALFAFTSVLD